MDDMLYGSGGENIQSGETDSAQWRPYAESEHMTTDFGKPSIVKKKDFL